MKIEIPERKEVIKRISAVEVDKYRINTLTLGEKAVSKKKQAPAGQKGEMMTMYTFPVKGNNGKNYTYTPTFEILDELMKKYNTDDTDDLTGRTVHVETKSLKVNIKDESGNITETKEIRKLVFTVN